MNKVPWKVWSGKRSNFVLEKSGKPQSDFCTNPVIWMTSELLPCRLRSRWPAGIHPSKKNSQVHQWRVPNNKHSCSINFPSWHHIRYQVPAYRDHLTKSKSKITLQSQYWSTSLNWQLSNPGEEKWRQLANTFNYCTTACATTCGVFCYENFTFLLFFE